jgi:GNAT superfamily N-acetyltransferase
MSHREFNLRTASIDDVPELERLIPESVRSLSSGHYSERQIEAALGTAFGVDTQLIRDGTYFVAEAAGKIVGSGGWSRRKTLFGGDAQPDRQSELLDPSRDAARIRAFFVRPDWARRGVARALLEKCEQEARAEGFKSAELVATLPGHRLYSVCGYRGDQRLDYPLVNEVTIEFIPMKKDL